MEFYGVTPDYTVHCDSIGLVKELLENIPEGRTAEVVLKDGNYQFYKLMRIVLKKNTNFILRPETMYGAVLFLHQDVDSRGLLGGLFITNEPGSDLGRKLSSVVTWFNLNKNINDCLIS